MKKLFILFAMAMMVMSVMAKDIIYRSTNDSVQAKVLTVNQSEITYKLAGYEDGPLFTINKHDVMAIRYANGVYQTFANRAQPQNNQQAGKTAQTRPKKGACFIGGTASVGYTSAFTFALEPVIGYEFDDRLAIGTGIGMIASIYTGYSYGKKIPSRAKAYCSSSTMMGIVEPFIRVCAWHNDIVFIDFKATAGIGFTRELELLQVGLRPSLRVRLTEHCEMSADLGLFGAQCTYDTGWMPAIGISATSAGVWFVYRF